MPPVGARIWAIPEGCIPGGIVSSDRALASHEAACILNAGARDAQGTIALLFEDREPIGPYRPTGGAHRTRHLRFNDLADPTPVPRDIGYASLIESSEPIVVQHSRLDSRDPHIARLSIIAWTQG
ncbi:MAG TPA: sensory rhodopsin transducer [Dongiaceae bacterium]|nr:sensory rhodopsin transducer [Dongiaceae bacterium]